MDIFSVPHTPAKAGAQSVYEKKFLSFRLVHIFDWTPACAGVNGYYLREVS